MALKDWKKTMIGGWTNNNNLKKIRVRKAFTSGKLDEKYSFSIFDKNWKKRDLRFFKTKAQALAYASAYMRTH